MSENAAPQAPPDDHAQAPKIEQQAGDHAIQVGQVSGNVTFQKTSTKVFQVFSVKALGILLASLALTAGGVFGWRYLAHKPAVMTGDFNIAVAEFGEVTDQGLQPSAHARQISQQLFDFLDSEYKATDFSLNIQTAHKNIPVLTEDREAERLAEAIHADLIIYGSVYIRGDEAKLTPKFYVANQPVADELTGTSELAQSVIFDLTSLASEEEVHVELQSRAAILVAFTKGLIFLSNDKLDAATVAFQLAIQEAETFGSFQGQEVLYMSAAFTSNRQDNLQQAEDYVARALQLNPEYARAYIVRGNIYFSQARQASYDEALFQKALTEYEKALNAKDQEGAYIREKVSYARGNVYLILAQTTQNPALLKEVIQFISPIVEQYEKTPRLGIRDLACSAYYVLGVTYRSLENYAQAFDMYQHCVRLAGPARKREKAGCSYGLGLLYQQRGNTRKALDAYQQCLDFVNVPWLKPDCFRGVGVMSEERGDSQRAAEAYQQCLKLAENPDLKAFCMEKSEKLQ